MLKEVGASGQILLGKRFAGQLFEVVFHPDGRVEMLPMKAVPAVPPPSPLAAELPSEAWLPPGGYGSCNRWALENRQALQAYAQRIERHGTAADELQAYVADEAAKRRPGAG